MSNTMSNTAEDKKRLRQQLRALRQQLTPDQQQQAAEGLYRVLSPQDIWINSQHIAAYITNDGEIDPLPLVEQAWQRGKHIYLPVLDPDKTDHLLFLPWRPETVMTHNRLGIPEPNKFDSEPFSAEKLDLILLPLTGFDREGKRLGMGGGFYDRTLKAIGNTSSIYLAGLAHECQKVEQVPTDDWDIPVATIYTDAGCYPRNNR